MRWRKPAKRTDHDALHFPGTPGWRLLGVGAGERRAKAMSARILTGG